MDDVCVALNNSGIEGYCMPNMDRLVQPDNSKKRKDVVYNVGGAGCICTDKPGCPVNGTCKSQNVVYQARVTSEGKEEYYIGLTSTEFKTRFRNHKALLIGPIGGIVLSSANMYGI